MIFASFFPLLQKFLRKSWNHFPQCLLRPSKKVNLIFPLLEIRVSMSPFTQQSWRSRIKTVAWGGDVETVFLRTYLHSEGEEAKFKWISQSRARFRTQKLYTNSIPTMNAGLFIHIFLNSAFFPLLDFILIFLYISSLQPISIWGQIRSSVLSKLRKLCSEHKINYFVLRSLKKSSGGGLPWWHSGWESAC